MNLVVDIPSNHMRKTSRRKKPSGSRRSNEVTILYALIE